MDYRIFKLNNELCLIHYPEKPNGFGVLIIGNEEHFVDEMGSYWLRNNTRLNIIKTLTDRGYTIFYSNLTGKHMGSNQAAMLAKDLYEYIKRTEILNEKIHIIAEGFGAMIVNNFIESKQDSIRSVVYINPIFSYSWMKEIVEDQPFMFKRFLTDLAAAFGMREEECERILNKSNNVIFPIISSTKIIHILEHGLNDEKWIKLYKNSMQIATDMVHVILPEKRLDISRHALQLFKLAETQL